MENLKNLEREYNTFYKKYRKLVETKSTNFVEWLTLCNNVSILCYRAKDFELFYDVQNLKHEIMYKMIDINVAK